VRAVDAKFEEHNFPYDVIWLDIEHTNGKRYFTWDSNLFPDSVRMINDIASKGRKVVTIVDPHLKRDGSYNVHTEAQAAGVYVQNKDGGEFDGWCWPGSSSYVDFTNAKARSWWADRFKLENYKGSTMDLFTWNDMNEPSVFNGPEVTMQKDTKAIDGQESREWHNLYGFYMQMATNEGQIRRKEDRSERPFLLSRSFFAGSQRYGAIWTGDNAGKWDHLEIANAMLLSFNVAGLPFIGSDTGGFFGNPNEELMTRWFQASAYHPFFRAHAHHDAKRREPYVFGEPHTSRLRQAVVTRYQHLPLWYTLFHLAHTDGMPVMRAMWMEFPTEERLFNVDDTFMVGDSLMVKPITSSGTTSTSVYFPGVANVQRWYDTTTRKEYKGGVTETISAPIDFIPVFQRGGTIVPKQMRVRRSSKLMVNDPYTLVVALDHEQSARGELYFDDFHTFAYETAKAYSHRQFIMTGGNILSSTDASQGDSNSNNFSPTNTVERIVIVGLSSAPTSATVTTKSGERSLEFAFDATTQTLTLRKPDMLVSEDWRVALK
jgi:mannosyl-oligosaccharide alpha-1,3-glucosidase